ncbi:MAG: DNA methyltransferase, partial [Fluviibacter sp.]
MRTNNQPLAKPLRNQLENAVKSAREISEKAAQAALAQLAVGEAKAPDYLTDEHKALRRRLRAHGRALGDELNANGSQTLQHLVWEGAYEHWHRMLFARFLAENGLLLWEPGAAVSLDDCEALVQEVDPAMNLGAKTQWELAGKLAARMLPQVFKPQSPVFELTFAPEHQRELERLLATLPPEVFKASDSLGWVYQFWQAKRKDEVNASEVKIGADELPAVTQLFTEPYMVDFLLHNSLGAWWAARRLSEQDLREAQTEDELRRKAAIPGVPLDYLRFVFAPAPHDDDDDVVRASSPEESEESGQDGLTTQARVPFDERTLEKTHGEYLPHWTCQGAVYHVVFRLADSVPQSKLAQWDEDLAAELTDEALREARYRKHQEMENWLDAGHGVCHFRQPEIAELVANALKHFDGDRYQLHAWCVMPNHVHVIVEPLSDNPLYKIIHSWKSFTANAINRQLGVSGTLWQADAYNHIIRTQKEYDYQVQYVWQNPDKANLPDWPWRWANVVIRASSPEESEESGQDGLTTAGWMLAAGAYEGWPDTLANFKLLDPCCGSGHFLVAAFLLLVPMRMVAEDLTAAEAVDAVLRDNLHGLELDARCVEIAVFALALAAWRFPDENGDPLGVRADMPAPQVACCGLKVAAKPEDWEALVPGDAKHAAHLREGLTRLHQLFVQAPLLGSLLSPGKTKGDLFGADYRELGELLRTALARESAGKREDGKTHDGDIGWDAALSALGLLDAARLLDGRYHLVVTNVPYLARGKQNNALKEYCETHYPEAKNDLANVFLERCLELCVSVVRASSPEKADQDGLNAVVRASSPEKSGQDGLTTCKESGQDGLVTGVVQIVMPQNWLFLTSYKKQRESLLKRVQWNLLGRLGPGAFETISGEVVQAVLLTQTNAPAAEGFQLRGVDASSPKSAQEKATLLREGEVVALSQKWQLGNPDARIVLGEASELSLLEQFARSYQGITTGDNPRYIQCFWEQLGWGKAWNSFQSTGD